jgi:hypothetical protein
MDIPYLYKKIGEKFNDRIEFTIDEFKKGLLNFRITEKDWFAIAKELQLQNLCELDVKANKCKGKIKFNHRKGIFNPKAKWYIVLFFVAWGVLLTCIILLMLGYSFL